MSNPNSDHEFVPYTKEISQHRILVVGKSGVGKSSLINAVFGVNSATAVSHNTPGIHNIELDITYSSNDRIILHDSQGFEPGEKENFRKVTEFIDRWCNALSPPSKRLHGIWVCAEIPISGARLFETGVEHILKKYHEDVPIIVVFTKLDLLYLHVETKVEEEFDELDDDEFEAKVEERVQKEIQARCVKELSALTPNDPSKFPWVVTSTDNESKFKPSIRKLVEKALSSTRQESDWIGLAIAQRVNAQASIEASVRVGRKRYWSGLFSDTFVGRSMKRLLDVLHREIIDVWNMPDPAKLLSGPRFLDLVLVMAEDLSDQPGSPNPVTTKPAPLFSGWGRQADKKPNNSLLCMVAYIIDLTLTMDTLFYLTISRRQDSISIELINKALLTYKAQKDPVHKCIREWSDHCGTFGRMNPDGVINKVQEILFKYSIQPETWTAKGVDMDNTWISTDRLRRS